MTTRSVKVYPPTRRAGRQVWVDGKSAGSVASLGELTGLLNRAGWPALDEVDVAELPLIEWYGGGPEVWTRWSADPWQTTPHRQPEPQ
ncbi:hypothetical protein ABT119_09505 [Streptomyces sp. NPDC001910]|uniref:hypothetical protein n=1 Tax=Streptomyces sp. NPDC001910 TaxID=3154403 RepID=UPI00332882A0